MTELQEAMDRIGDLKGSLVALEALVATLLQEMPAGLRSRLLQSFAVNVEVARTVLVHAPIAESTVRAFERDVSRMSDFMTLPSAATPPPEADQR